MMQYADLPELGAPFVMTGGDYVFPAANGEWYKLTATSGTLIRMVTAPDAWLQHPEQSDADWLAGRDLNDDS